jgi:predicted TIM-barrel fold metal-dependent hydrolase
MKTTRRSWLGGITAGGLNLLIPRNTAAEAVQAPQPDPKRATGSCPLSLQDFQPKSMLHVKESHPQKAKFPVIDVHTHLGWARRQQGKIVPGEMNFLATPQELLATMDRKNIQTMVNLTGGTGAALEKSIQHFEKAAPGRFVTFVEPSWHRVDEPGYDKTQADEIEKAKKAGARGVKVLKALGLVVRENDGKGPLLKVDDKRFDPMWDACGSLGMPVCIHTSDPEAFFLTTDRYNERYEELQNHPDWSFHGKDYPSNQELLDARNRVFARHPKTAFITLHVGNNAENLAAVGENLDRFPNMNVEIGARIGELGRQPRTARKFFDKYQDRILFGTDAVPKGFETPQQIFGDQLYEIYYRFLETEDEYFDYAPAPVPPQGRWRIYGLGLPDAMLKKVYHDNAARLLGLS